MDKQISKDKSKGIKFIAVVIMVILHVFGFPDRIAPYSYKSLLMFGGGDSRIIFSNWLFNSCSFIFIYKWIWNVSSR